MNTQTLTMIIGFLGVIFTIVSLNNQLRKEIKEDVNKEISRLEISFDKKISGLEISFDKKISKLEDEIKDNKNEIKALSTKLDSFLMAVFSKTISQTTYYKDDKDAA